MEKIYGEPVEKHCIIQLAAQKCIKSLSTNDLTRKDVNDFVIILASNILR